jgi:uncharacterized protein (DUF488 family)
MSTQPGQVASPSVSQPGVRAVLAIRGPLLTLGHGTLAAEAFAGLVVAAGVELVVDVRSYPGSRRHPHFGREAMTGWLPAAGVAYQWEPRLGGRRRGTTGSPHVALRNDAFRAYADHMGTDEFADGLDRLAGLAADRRVAIMCAESLWWRCHRRLAADAAAALHGLEVRHLFHDGRTIEHRLSPEARVVDGRLVYDGGVLLG